MPMYHDTYFIIDFLSAHGCIMRAQFSILDEYIHDRFQKYLCVFAYTMFLENCFTNDSLRNAE